MACSRPRGRRARRRDDRGSEGGSMSMLERTLCAGALGLAIAYWTLTLITHRSVTFYDGLCAGIVLLLFGVFCSDIARS